MRGTFYIHSSLMNSSRLKHIQFEQMKTFIFLILNFNLSNYFENVSFYAFHSLQFFCCLHFCFLFEVFPSEITERPEGRNCAEGANSLEQPLLLISAESSKRYRETVHHPGKTQMERLILTTNLLCFLLG